LTTYLIVTLGLSLIRSPSQQTNNMGQKAAPSTVPITVMEIEEIARKKLPDNVYNYYACGADEQKAMARNSYAFDK
jgi:hypothetical protein